MMKNKKQVFGLTQKFYLLLSLLATTIYSIGIWVFTPPTHPAMAKNLVLGIMVLVQLFILVYYLFKKTKEKPDERFYTNLAKAASIMFFVCMALFVLVDLLMIKFGSNVLRPGTFLIGTGVLILMFGILYFLFEKKW